MSHSLDPSNSNSRRPSRSTALATLAGGLFAGLIVVGAPAAAAGCGSASFSGGDGSSGSPYEIATAADLETLSTTRDVWGCDYVQTSDIVLDATPGVANHDPIGTADDGSAWDQFDQTTWDPFTGVYDGGGHTISNLTVVGDVNDLDEGFLGLFGLTDGATITDLTLADPTVIGVYSGQVWSRYHGPLIGYAKSTSISGVTVEGASVMGESYSGGVVGYAVGITIDDVSVEVDIDPVGDGDGGYAGGLLGTAAAGPPDFDEVAVITDVTVVADVVGNNTIGGVVGYASTDTSISGLVATVSVESIGSGGYGVGAVLGYNSPNNQSTVERAVVTGSIAGPAEVGAAMGVVDKLGLDTVVLDVDVTGTGTDDRVGCYAGSAEDLDDTDLFVGEAVSHAGTLTIGDAEPIDCGPQAPQYVVTVPSITIAAGEAIPAVGAPSGAFDGGGAVTFDVVPTCTTDDGTGNPVTSATPPGTYDIVCEGAVVFGALPSYVAGTLTITAAEQPTTTSPTVTTAPGGTLPATGSESAPATLAVLSVLCGVALIAVARRRMI